MNQTFQIPEGVKQVKVDQVDGKIIIEFVPEKVEFKDGDIVASNKEDIIFIYNHKGEDNEIYFHFALTWNEIKVRDWLHSDFCNRLATEEEKAKLFDRMTEQGYTWNDETKQVEKKRWRAKVGGVYWTFSTNTCKVFDSREIYCDIDNNRYNNGFYFQTEEQAKSAFEKVKSLLLSLHDVN